MLIILLVILKNKILQHKNIRSESMNDFTENVIHSQN